MDCPPCGTIEPAGGTIDDGDACFVAGGPARYLRHADAGDQGDLLWTHATASDHEVSFAQWNLFLAEAGRYRVEVNTPHAYATSHQAAYMIQAAGTPTTFVVDQSATDGWQVLGELEFAAHGAQWVHLADNTGEPLSLNAQLVFDAVRLTRVTDEPGPGGNDGSGGGDGSDGSHDRDGGGCATSPGAAPWLIGLSLIALRRRRSPQPRGCVRRCHSPWPARSSAWSTFLR
jgi:MYXO-CTERM domain-containing protein